MPTQRHTSRLLAAGLSASVILSGCGSTVAIDGGVPAGDPAAVGPSATEAGSEDDGLAFAPQPSASPSNATGLSAATGTGTGTTGSSPGTSSSLPDSSGAQPPAAGAQPPATGTQPPSSGGEQPAAPPGGTQPGQPAQPGEPAPPAEQAPPEGGPARGGTTAPGITDEEIVVGIAVQDDSDPGNSELLGADIGTGDGERYYEIIRDEINANGGVAGRQIRYSVFRFSTAGGAQISQLEGQACQFWSRDDRAFAVSFTSSPNFLGCAEDNGLVTINGPLNASDARTFTEFPHHVEASAMDLTRTQANMVAGLDAQGYFGPRPGQVVAPGEEAVVMGTVLWEAPAFVRAFEESLLPALEARGVAFDPENQARIKRLESNEDLAEISSQVQSAVLRFRSQGVTNVTFVEDNGLLFFLFARSAENQGYRPRYGLTSKSGTTTIARQLADAGAGEQLRDALGIGWVSSLDVPADERPLTPAGRACLDLMAREGAQASEDNVEGIQLGTCEYLQLLKVAVEAGLPDITPDSFVAGVNTLGTSFPAYTGLQTNAFGPDRHAGEHVYRTLAWDPDCVCFHYSSDPVSDLRRR